MKLDALLIPELERLQVEGLFRDPADATARFRMLASRALTSGDGSGGESDSTVPWAGLDAAANGGAEEKSDGRPLGFDATSNDYLGLAQELVDVSRETSPAMVDREHESRVATATSVAARPTNDERWASPPTRLVRDEAGLGCDARTWARAGAGASRLVQGTWPEHEALEAELASWVGAEAALLFSSGFAANLGAISALAGADSVVLSDALNHASIVDGCRLARAQTVVVPHLDMAALETALVVATNSRARWVVTESYFSMDGDGPDLLALRRLCDRHDALLVVDEAHALGVFGPRGAGRCAEAGIHADVLVGTLGKAVGTEGAFVAGSRSLRTWLWNRARSFVFSTAPSPAGCALTLRHVKQAAAAEGSRLLLREHSRHLRTLLSAAGLPLVPGAFGPIVSVVAGSNPAAIELSRSVRADGILVQAIRPPTVPPGQARVRVTLTAALTNADVERLAHSLIRAWRTLSA